MTEILFACIVGENSFTLRSENNINITYLKFICQVIHQ